MIVNVTISIIRIIAKRYYQNCDFILFHVFMFVASLSTWTINSCPVCIQIV